MPKFWFSRLFKLIFKNKSKSEKIIHCLSVSLDWLPPCAIVARYPSPSPVKLETIKKTRSGKKRRSGGKLHVPREYWVAAMIRGLLQKKLTSQITLVLVTAPIWLNKVAMKSSETVGSRLPT